MGDQSLRAAATAMTDLANALEQGTEKSLIRVEYFLGDGTQALNNGLKNSEELLLQTNGVMPEN